MKQSLNSSRRSFVKQSSALGLGLAVAPYYLMSDKKQFLANAKPNVGLIGCGSRGLGLAKILSNLDNLNFIACCDIMPEKIAAVQKIDSKIQGYADYEKLLMDANIDAVVIASPLFLHYEMSKNAIDAGKDIYLEKTMAYSIKETLDLEKRVVKSGTILEIGHQYRYYNLYHKIKEVIDKGWIGKVLQYESQYHNNSDWRRPVSDPALERQINWRMYREYSGGVMAELAAHQIDVVNWMVGAPPVKVNGLGGIDYWKDGRETYDNARAVYEYPNGIKSNVSSILMNGYNGYQLRILGTDGTINVARSSATLFSEKVKREIGVVDGVTGATIPMEPGKGEELVFDNEGKSPTEHALYQFGECVVSRATPLSNCHTGKETAIAVHMANHAMRKEKTQYWKNSYNL
ncbi:Gfo/Idh/MocA family protein [Membranihabitans marinus]|uniref:Gfo/Idh/MocA family protein n=1 Tax=Membranihabitans marinus TaxID=1227546 RepID=UPI001F360273|nr:Gfo/Idh/MocA family oxidoreductase [Membranihabitans marinus]